ncbi:MAG TPA: thermonuclease family protein [Bacillales bacterium]|nr:thermonuclease family protein [Bacillales bacterium]
MKESTKKPHKPLWNFILLSMFLAVLLAGCGGTSGAQEESDGVDQAAAEKQTDTNSESKEDQESKEDLPTEEELEAEYGGDIEHPESELIDITEEVIVTKVIDGDTVVVEGENGEETVDLLLIDTPELTLPDGSPDEWFGAKSYDYTKRWVGSEALLERGEPGKNEQGHTLGYIWMSDGAGDHFTFNKVLLQDGMARLTDASGGNTKYLEVFKKAEAKAKAAQEDIWSIEGYVTDDGFDSSLVQ